LTLKLVLASVALVATSATALADVTLTFDVSASDFTPTAGPGSDAPTDPVDIILTLTFDPSTSIGPTTSGLVVHTFTLNYPVAYAYNPTSLAVASQPSVQPSGVGCALAPSSWCLIMSDPAGTNPDTTQFQQTTADGSLWSAQNISTEVTPGASVLEPATWALLMVGLAALGFHARARLGPALQSSAAMRIQRF
jgi:hypothetical protein